MNNAKVKTPTRARDPGPETTVAPRSAEARPGPDAVLDTQTVLQRMRNFYVKRDVDRDLRDLLDDMADRTLVNSEGRAVILAGPSGAGKTTVLNRVTRGHPQLDTAARGDGPPGMVFVQVPPACTVADLGIAIARAAGWPVKDGLKSSIAWGCAMRVLMEKKIRFLWLDEMSNITSNLNTREARKIRTHVKMSLIDVRHTMGLVLSGDTSIVNFLLADGHVLRRSDVIEMLPVEERMFKVVELAVGELARKVGMRTSPDLGPEVVPRLVHAALGQFGTSLEMTRTTIMRATRRGRLDVAGATPMLGLDDYAFSWARAYGVHAAENPFVVRDWSKLDCAAIIARAGREAEPVVAPRAKGLTQGRVL